VLVVSSVAAVVLGVFYFISNDLKVAMLAVTAGIFVYGFLVDRFGNIHIQVKEEYTE
jgi:APA family basic amino acid/polyamine antiporter